MITLKCEREVAIDSPDHITPTGTRQDNSTNIHFNRKLNSLYGNRELSILDLGCSGGGFVRDCINDGHLAVGLEGSDYSKKRRRAEWAIIPEYLFTCDITKEFSLFNDELPMKFDVITTWEVMEHIKEADIPKVCENVHRHLMPGGMWILSISTDNETNLHQTIMGKEGWIYLFRDSHFHHLKTGEAYFNSQYIRGKELKDSFNLVLTNSVMDSPNFTKLGFWEDLQDRWNGSPMQRFIRAVVLNAKKQ